MMKYCDVDISCTSQPEINLKQTEVVTHLLKLDVMCFLQRGSLQSCGGQESHYQPRSRDGV